MGKKYSTLVDYLYFLASKGFHFKEEDLNFIQLGRRITESNDQLVIAALEAMLRDQREFDGSYFIALLEMFQEQKISTREQAVKHLNKIGLSK